MLILIQINIKKILKRFLLLNKNHIDHVVPKQWCHYDGWDESTHDTWIHSIGTLIPLEEKLNIKSSNEFFEKKKKSYEDSLIPDAKSFVIS